MLHSLSNIPKNKTSLSSPRHLNMTSKLSKMYNPRLQSQADVNFRPTGSSRGHVNSDTVCLAPQQR